MRYVPVLISLAVLMSGLQTPAQVQAQAQAQPQVQQGESRKIIDSGFSSPSAQSFLTPIQAAAFAKQVERDLAAKGTRVAMVFRTGRTRDKLPKGIAYTHGAFWVYGAIKTTDGREIKGYSVHNLYRGDGKTLSPSLSYLHQDYPFDFVAATAVDDVAVIIPSPEMQRRILNILVSPRYEALHVKSYSLVANPLNAPHQNCNEFMLDVLASAAWETQDYAQIKANLSAHYKPTKVRTNLFQRVLGPMVDKTLQLDDQSGDIVTATYESMSEFMKAQNLLKDSYIIYRQP
jgi:hypothetical protein